MERAPSSRTDHGFTLIEILVALVVVGILAVVVILGISSVSDSGNSAACTHSRDAAGAASLAHYTNTGVFPARFSEMTGPNPPEMQIPSDAIVDATGTILTTSGWSLTLTPSVGGAPPTFSCGGGSSSAATGSGTTTTLAGGGTTTTAVGGGGTTTTLAGGGTTTSTTTSTTTTTTIAATTTTAVGSTPGTSACPGSFAGWVGEYYSNMNLTGSPAFCRDDAAINFDWGSGSPKSGFPNDDFSIRWTKKVTFANGNHKFSIAVNDAYRLYIDGTMVSSQWPNNGFESDSVTKSLSGVHTIVMEYYAHTGSAQASLSWT